VNLILTVVEIVVVAVVRHSRCSISIFDKSYQQQMMQQKK